MNTAFDIPLMEKMQEVFPEGLKNDDVIFLCIGTDRATGDAFGPLIGTYLEKAGYQNVVGTLDLPVHSQNLAVTVSQLDKGKTIIAIDSALGEISGIGKLNARGGSLRPGAGVKRELGEVGDYSITGVVNVGGFMEYVVLHNTRLATVMRMADEVVSAIQIQFPLTSQCKLERKEAQSA